MPDKSPKKNLTKKPSYRVSEEELEIIKANAKKAGLSLSEYQRQACLNPVIVVKESVADVKLIHQLLRIGTNLNQLTKHANIHKNYDSKRLNMLLAQLEPLVFELIGDVEE